VVWSAVLRNLPCLISLFSTSSGPSCAACSPSKSKPGSGVRSAHRPPSSAYTAHTPRGVTTPCCVGSSGTKWRCTTVRRCSAAPVCWPRTIISGWSTRSTRSRPGNRRNYACAWSCTAVWPHGCATLSTVVTLWRPCRSEYWWTLPGAVFYELGIAWYIAILCNSQRCLNAPRYCGKRLITYGPHGRCGGCKIRCCRCVDDPG
jgi:hypothetical protein